MLLAASLFFYAWGEVFYVGIMLLSILSNYLLGIIIDRTRNNKIAISAAILINLLILCVFKYAAFIISNINNLLGLANLGMLPVPDVHLPLGVSFFTFQAMSYIFDIYRRKTKPSKNAVNVALYISMFPQVVAGPIIRYHDIEAQLRKRGLSFDDFVEGIRRFIMGLAKKVLIADSLAVVVDHIFSVPAGNLSSTLSWIGIAGYTLQIYYDFSGYSDMAIGLARMFGFHIMENFNYPYIARSIREFWRRWHISLATWFRDYLYIPLGGNRNSTPRTYFNLITVFFLVGLWHGASWNFVAWGLCHGFFIIIERVGFAKVLEQIYAPLAHAYTLMVVMLTFVIFRTNTLHDAMLYYNAMFDFSNLGIQAPGIRRFMDHEFFFCLFLGIIGAAPVIPMLSNFIDRLLPGGKRSVAIILGRTVTDYTAVGVLIMLLIVSVIKISAGTFHPFIYFRF
ncbi:MAG: MBOAT family protein [Thermodesulfobacteriota bacterium]|nr:MBOAT family protein [Thermodesulfobacteriota bacterium]